MVKRDQIYHGVKLRAVQQLHHIAPGTVGTVTSISEARQDAAWAFSLYWQDYSLKNRYSLYFSEADIEAFEILTEDTAEALIRPSRRARYSAEQLDLPFTEWVLYRGSDIVDTFETWL